MDSLAMETTARYATTAVAETVITEKIHFIRGQKLMLDRDLAELHGAEVERLKEQVRRNIERFPQDLMFELTLKRGENTKYPPSPSRSTASLCSPTCCAASRPSP